MNNAQVRHWGENERPWHKSEEGATGKIRQTPSRAGGLEKARQGRGRCTVAEDAVHPRETGRGVQHLMLCFQKSLIFISSSPTPATPVPS